MGAADDLQGQAISSSQQGQSESNKVRRVTWRRGGGARAQEAVRSSAPTDA